MGILLFVLIVRLAYLQILNHEHFTTLSRENRLKIVPIVPPRGSIFSRDGTALAENRSSFSVAVIPENAVNLDAAVLELGKFLDLSDEQLESFSKRLNRAGRFENVTLKSDLNPEELAIFSVNRFLFPGFRIEAGVARHYPLAGSTAHVIGYVGRISETDLKVTDQTNYSATTHIGKSGVEKAREDILHGRVGYQRVEVNAQGRILRIVERTPPVAGKDIYLTLDADLQVEAINALGGRRGAIVAIDPASGGILAFVSQPSFDPNEWRKYSPGKILLEKLMQWCCVNGVKNFDFTDGDALYKRNWSNNSCYLYDVKISNSFKGFFYLFFLRIIDLLKKITILKYSTKYFLKLIMKIKN